jgi:hypothetical protein
VKKITLYKIAILTSIVLTISGFNGCGGSSSSSSSSDIVNISASIPANKVAYNPSTTDKLLAFIGISPLFADYIDSANKVVVVTPDYSIVKYDINTNGTFSIDLNSSKSNAIFLVNDNTKEVVGSVSVPVTSGSNTTLDMMPKSKITTSLNLGELTLNSNSGKATSSTVNIDSNFNSDSEMKSMANIDDTSKLYANAYRNPYHRLFIEWQFKIKTARGDGNVSLSQVTDSFVDINANDGRDTKLIFKSSKPTIVSQNDLASTDIKVYLPTNSLGLDHIPYQNSAYDITDTYYGLSNFKLYTQTNNIVKTDASSYGNDSILGVLPSGEYTLKVDGTTQARFDMVNIAPFNNSATSSELSNYSDRNCTAPIISQIPLVLVKLNTDPSDNSKFKSVTWKFVRHNGTSYIDLTDNEVSLFMQQDISGAEITCSLKDSNHNELGYAVLRANQITTNNPTVDIQIDEDTATKTAVTKTDLKKIDSMLAHTNNDYIYNYNID